MSPRTATISFSYRSTAADGILPDHASSVLPFLVESDVALSRSNVRVTSSDSKLVKVMETCFYKVAGPGGSHDNYYLGAAYLQSGSASGDIALRVSINSPNLSQTESAELGIAVRPQVSEIIFMTSNVAAFKSGNDITNHDAYLIPGKSLVLRAYVRNIDDRWWGMTRGMENSFDNVYHVPAKKLKWSTSGYNSSYVKINKKTGKITFRKRGAKREYYGPAIYAEYKYARTRGFNVTGIKKARKPSRLTIDKVRRKLLLRGETRVLCANADTPFFSFPSGKLKWSSSNKNVAGVSSFGLVKAKSVGKVTFTVKLGGKKAKASYRVVPLETYMREYYEVSGDGAISVDDAVMWR
jgi:hypothetical protein